MQPNTAVITHIEVVIHTTEELNELTSFASLFKRYTKVVLDIKDMESGEQQKYEEQINRFYGACGCGEGKFFVLLGFLTFLVYSYYTDTLEFTWLNAGKGFLFCMAGAAVGKLFGLYRANLKLKKVVIEMISPE